MSSDYEYSDDDDYYDGDDMDTQEDAYDDSEEELMELDDFKPLSKGKQKAYDLRYTSLSQTNVEERMNDDVEYVCSVLSVDADSASLLLRHLSWNKERLVEKYMDNPDSLTTAAGLSASATPVALTRLKSPPPPPSRKPTRSNSKLLGGIKPGTKSPAPLSPTTSFTTPKILKSPILNEPFVCPICCDDSPTLKPVSLECTHAYCTNCWTDYVGTKVNEEGDHIVRCMGEGCSLVAPDAFVHSILVPAPGAPIGDPTQETANANTWKRYQELLIRHFVASHRDLKYCPYPSCTNTVSCPDAASKLSLTTIVPTVSCGARGLGDQMTKSQLAQGSLSLAGKEHRFCFGCNVDSDHRPVICGVARMWLKKCQDDSETANWIKSNTKECSNCQSTIEKNGGCNHMTCKKCKHEFCWVCMGPWSEHGTAWYSCNRYDEKGGVDARDAQSKSRASLERYLHYYNRWANHEQSAKLSVDLYAKTEKKMEDMQVTSSLTWIEVQFMKKAVEEVEKCRMTLKWTYAMAYYLASGNQKDLFEDNQRDLEKAVEDLSELLESPIEPENISTLRQKVTDKTVYVQKRNEIVLDDTATGFLDGRWSWNVCVEGFDDPPRDD